MKPLPPVKLLLVDDLEENLRALDALLSRDGVELLHARSGRDALELLLVHDVALVLLDVQMPEMDGFEVAELMRGTERTRQVPIIFLTAGSHDSRRVFRGYELGAVDFLFKPFDPVMLGHKVAVFVDLHRRGLEREQLVVELGEMLRLNEMFVAAVTHDLRSPLSTVVTGGALLDRAVTEAQPRRTLGRVRSAADRMCRMLDQLYDLARARLGGGIGVEPASTTFARTADGLLDELRVAFPERALVVERPDAEVTGRWDEARIGQTLANLVGNALRHGTPDTPVTLRVRTTADALTVEVHNGGVIPPEVLPSIFDPFRRGVHEASRESLGLGLFITRQIVDAHGGAIEVSSSAERGTTFSMTLPLAGRGREGQTA